MGFMARLALHATCDKYYATQQGCRDQSVGTRLASNAVLDSYGMTVAQSEPGATHGGCDYGAPGIGGQSAVVTGKTR